MGGAAAAVGVGVAIMTGGVSAGLAAAGIAAYAGGKAELRGGNMADVATAMGGASLAAGTAGKITPALPAVAKAGIGITGTISFAVKGVRDVRAAGETFSNPQASTKEKILSGLSVVEDIAGLTSSAILAYHGLSDLVKVSNIARQPKIKSPDGTNRSVECGNNAESTSGAENSGSKKYTSLRDNGDGTWTSNEERFKIGEPVAPLEKDLDMALDPELYAYRIVEKYGINLKGSGHTISIRYDPNLPLGIAGKTIESDPTEIVLGRSAFISESELANTIAHELNHARSWLNGGTAPEVTAYAAGDALSDYIEGVR